MTDLDLPVAPADHRGQREAERLRAVTLEVEPDTAEQLLNGAAELCTSWSRGQTQRAGCREAAISCLRSHGVVIRSQRRTIVGLGIAARLSVATHRTAHRAAPIAARAIARQLASVLYEDPLRRMGSSPMALGGLAFDPSAASQLVIPEVVVVAEPEGLCWVTVTADAGTTAQDLESTARLIIDEICSIDPAGDESVAQMDGWKLSDGGEPAFTRAVRTALEEIEAGTVSKVVLARRAVVAFDRPVDLAATLKRLRRRESASTVFAITSPTDAFIGASPELLVARDGPLVRSVPLAGSVRTRGDAASDDAAIAEMVASAKENFEHRVVVRAIADLLERHCSALSVPDHPEVLRLRQISHLATAMTGELRYEPANRPGALELACILHPTPAVGGSPTGAAVALIRALEPSGRGRYAGPVGWMDSNGDGEFFIGIRSAEVRRDHAVLFAGAGIVADSDPRFELDETSLKLETMLGALRSG